MEPEQLKAQQINLLAKKALLYDEIKAVEASISQLAAVLKYQEAAAEKATAA